MLAYDYQHDVRYCIHMKCTTVSLHMLELLSSEGNALPTGFADVANVSEYSRDSLQNLNDARSLLKQSLQLAKDPWESVE